MRVGHSRTHGSSLVSRLTVELIAAYNIFAPFGRRRSCKSWSGRNLERVEGVRVNRKRASIW